jgi:radical SAM superfamily enzyme YgiQ (UPF0313 family)
MKVKLILPALTEATGPFWRPVKYSLFPPLGLATLAAYLDDGDEVELQDEHVETLVPDDEPDLVVIQAYITSAYRAYAIADHYRSKGAYVAMGGLHVTSLPDEAAAHADSIFLGPGEDTWPRFLADFRRGTPERRYQSSVRTLAGLPRIRRDLIKRHLYLVPNSIVVSRGCPHVCEFCYKEAFFQGGRSFYTQTVDAALAEIERLPGRHLYFLDDHLFGNPRFALALFEGMRGMGRLWQAAGTVSSVLAPNVLEAAVASGLRSLFVGFETLDPRNLREQRKYQNLNRDYAAAIARLHDHGVMINGSFVFGMDGDGEDVFERTVDWAVANGIETATFHILTPYPGTALYARMQAQRRLTTGNWDRYDTRHAVFQPARMSADALERGYRRAYKDFYRWGAIARGAAAHGTWRAGLRHAAYAAGWKKFEPLWDAIIRARRVGAMLPVLEAILSAGRGEVEDGRAVSDLRTKASLPPLPCHLPPQDVGLPNDDEVMRAPGLIVVQPLAVVAADALRQHDLRAADRAPLAGLLADAAGVALGPALDAEHGQLRQHAEKRADGAQEPAVRVPHEDAGEQQGREPDPERRRATVKAEHPEGFDVRVDQRVARDQEVGDDGREDAELDPGRASLQRPRYLHLPASRNHAIDELRQRAERA